MASCCCRAARTYPPGARRGSSTNRDTRASIEGVDKANIFRIAMWALGFHGWQQGKLIGDDGKLCAVSALQYALGRGATEVEVAACIGMLEEHVIETTASPDGLPCWDSIYDWNDEPSTTLADVLSAMREVAADLGPIDDVGATLEHDPEQWSAAARCLIELFESTHPLVASD